MQFQWYPGHMTKARRQMQEDIKLVDLVIELVDARIPGSSRNPDIDELGRNKARLILLNKADLADDGRTAAWADFFREKGYFVATADSRSKGSMKAVTQMIQEACREKTERDRKRGILNRPVRAMIVGIPNVGKSTFINTYAGKACAKTGNKPGVTKGKQWIRLNKSVELLDTPGILWPKFEDQKVGLHLALIGAIRDEILNIDELALALIELLVKDYPGDRHMTEESYKEERQTPDTEKGKKALKEVVNFALYIIVVLVLTYLVIHYVGQRTEVSGESMENTLDDKDNLIVDKITYRFRDPERFDIIVFPFKLQENTYYIKRIIGLPGETVRIDENGIIYINGEELIESYGREVIRPEKLGVAANEIVLGDDEYFVMGDNRNHSSDSRDPSVGNIKREDIIGRAWLRIYPFDKIGFIKHQ